MIAAVATAAMFAFAPSALAQDAAPETAEAEAETPWYETFTLSMDESPHPGLDEVSTIDWQSPAGRWGITLGIEDNPDARFEIEDMSAGAFVNVGDRFRIGGQLRFTSPEDDLFMVSDEEERQPEIMFESAVRF